MHPYLHYSIGFHGNGAGQHGLTVTVQAVPGDGGAGLSGSLAFQVDGFAQLDPDGSRGGDDGHRRVWGDQNSRRAQPLGGAPLSEPEQVWKTGSCPLVVLPFTITDTMAWVIPNGLLATQR